MGGALILLAFNTAQSQRPWIAKAAFSLLYSAATFNDIVNGKLCIFW